MITVRNTPIYLYFIIILFLAFQSTEIIAQITKRVSLSSDGKQLPYTPHPEEFFGESNVTREHSISADGRYVAFVTGNSKVTANDTNASYDVFVRDLLTRTTEVVSVNTSGKLGNDFSDTPSLSGNGRFIAFRSLASNFATGDTSKSYDIFVHDRQSKITRLVSKGYNGAKANGHSSYPQISADGRYVAFQSSASNLIANDTNRIDDVFVHDLKTKRTFRVSVNTNGKQAIGRNSIIDPQKSGFPHISSDGRYIAFESDAQGLVDEDTNNLSDVFVHDQLTRKTIRVSVSSKGEQTVPFCLGLHCHLTGGNNYGSSISADGQFVAFYSDANNLVPFDKNEVRDVFIHSLKTGTTGIISVKTDGRQTNDGSGGTAISANGRFVSFASVATNLDNFGAAFSFLSANVFVRDRYLKVTNRVNFTPSGGDNDLFSDRPEISADGREISFYSASTDLIDHDTNGGSDIFVNDRNLNLSYQADLQLNLVNKPLLQNPNGTAMYSYVVTNNGPDTIYKAKVFHLISNGQTLNVSTNLGSCKNYSAISLCELGKIKPGVSRTLSINIVGDNSFDPIIQTIKVSSSEQYDPKLGNNRLNIETPRK
ncbi:MAG: PD40 domain-containing protein [Methylococcaceae bacterium]|nr:PD40 domain-containing protein [Methylococcaceae bacterium]